MKIFDCTTFYNENLMLEIRFNILKDYVDYFDGSIFYWESQGANL